MNLCLKIYKFEVKVACAFGRVGEAVSGGKPPAGKGVVGL